MTLDEFKVWLDGIMVGQAAQGEGLTKAIKDKLATVEAKPRVQPSGYDYINGRPESVKDTAKVSFYVQSEAYRQACAAQGAEAIYRAVNGLDEPSGE